MKQNANIQLATNRQRLAYQALIETTEVNPEVWQDAHRILPNTAVHYIEEAVKTQGARKTAELILALTISPVHLFGQLGDGAAYQARMKLAAFASQESCDAFLRRFPDWDVRLADVDPRRPEWVGVDVGDGRDVTIMQLPEPTAVDVPAGANHVPAFLMMRR